MVFILGLSVLLATAAPVAGSPVEKSYWFLAKDDGAWCGYADQKAFRRAGASVAAVETGWARVSGGLPRRMTHVVQPESGDWIIEDTYDFSNGRVSLTRSTSLAEEQLRRIETGTAPIGSRPRLKTAAIRYLGTKRTAGGRADYPTQPIASKPAEFPFYKLLGTLSAGRAATVCERGR